MALRVFKTRLFCKFADDERVTDISICQAVRRLEDGLIDADLGGGLIKQRIARVGQGRSGGFRTLIAYRSGERAVFLAGFAKNVRDNLTAIELKELRKAGKAYLILEENKIEGAIAEGKLSEVDCNA